MQNIEQTIQSEYANSPVILQLINCMNAYLDPITNINNFYDMVWNIDTAVGYGLDVWGRIVGVQRVLQISNVVFLGSTGPAGTSGDSMNVQSFYNGTSITSNFSLSDDAFRTLIFAKALANICDGSIPAINQILINLFSESGQAWCTDGQNMTMTYTFAFTPTPSQLAIINQSGVLPRPCGVSVSIQTAGFFDNGGTLSLFSIAPGYPASSSGLSAGSLWNNNGVVSVIPGVTPNPAAATVYFGITNPAKLLAIGGGNLPLTSQTAGSGILWNNNGEVSVS